MKEISLQEILDLFDPSVRSMIKASAQATGATHIVCFENLALDSSEMGKRTALCVGPTCTYKSPEDCQGKWLGDLPSRRQYPQSFAKVEQ